MKTAVVLNQTVFDSLLAQLVELEEQIPSILDEYFVQGLGAKAVKQREEMDALLNQYLLQLDQLVRRAKVGDCDSNSLPLVVLGSIITLEDTKSNKVSEVVVVTPDDIDRQSGKISFFSPLGKALLLKKPGDEFEITVPRGAMQYRILSVTYQS